MQINTSRMQDDEDEALAENDVAWERLIETVCSHMLRVMLKFTRPRVDACDNDPLKFGGILQVLQQSRRRFQ